ncbi:complement C1q-like protein 4 [Saccostrea cucullata]|uniref:complement C1q-like protein 4 n=1 Tax=Saccostrea cuccullata TaxID=36930 RepID=UPI002ED46E63
MILFLYLGSFLSVSGLLLNNLGDECVTRNEFMTVIASLNSSIIKEKQRSNVAFVAELSHRITDPPNGFHIIFDKVKLDIGGNYKATHGIFLAPYPGIYHFAVEITSPPQSSQHTLHVRIMKKNQPVALTFSDGNTEQWLRRTGSIILQLDTGDDVWCRTESVSGTNTIAGADIGDTYSTFSGFIVHPL